MQRRHVAFWKTNKGEDDDLKGERTIRAKTRDHTATNNPGINAGVMEYIDEGLES